MKNNTPFFKHSEQYFDSPFTNVGFQFRFIQRWSV